MRPSDLANTTRAGLTLAQGFQSIAPDIPEPLGVEIRRIVRSFESGQPLSHAIREVKNRLELESFSVFASSVLVALEQGGQISLSLDKISVSLAEIQRLEQKIEASSAGGGDVWRLCLPCSRRCSCSDFMCLIQPPLA